MKRIILAFYTAGTDKMFNIVRWLSRLAARFAQPCACSPHEGLPLRDWADLPPYHPRCD